MRDWGDSTRAPSYPASSFPLPSGRERTTALERRDFGCLPFSQKIRKFPLKVKWNSNFPENPSENCGLPPEVLFFRSERNFGNFLTNYIISQFQSLINGKQNRKPNFKWQAPTRPVGLLILENPLPLFNVHPNRFLPTNGKHT